jgi:hypothetical protein
MMEMQSVVSNGEGKKSERSAMIAATKLNSNGHVGDDTMENRFGRCV